MKRARSPATEQQHHNQEVTPLREEDPSLVGEALFNTVSEALQAAKDSIEAGTLQVGRVTPGIPAAPTRVTSASFDVFARLFSSFVTEATGELRRHEKETKVASQSGAADNEVDDEVFHPNGRTVIELNQQLNIIQRQLRKWAGFGTIGQIVIPPKQSDTFEADVPTFEIDAFLYGDDEDVDVLCDAGKVSRNYCTVCKSTAVAPTQFITHSFSKDQLFYIFCFLVPYLRVADKSKPNAIQSLVDVGSRLGVVLASAFFTGPPLTKIVGIEMDEQLCGIQDRLIKSHRGMKDCVAVIHGDALTDANLAVMADSDLVVLHNVFEWFSEESAQLGTWKKLKAALSKRKGQYLLVCPGIQETLRPLVRAFGGEFDGKVQKASSKKAMSETEVDRCCNEFLKGWVEEVSCDIALVAFIEERRGGGGEDKECLDGSCGHNHDDEEVEEFVEHARNIHVYRVL